MLFSLSQLILFIFDFPRSRVGRQWSFLILWSVRSYAILGQDLIPSFPDLLLSHSSQKPLISSAPWLLLSWCQFSLSQDRSSCYMCVTFSVFIYQLILQTGCLFISDDSITWVDRHSVRLYSHRLIWLFWKGLLFQFHGWMDCFARDDFYSATVWSNRLIWLINLFHLGGSPIRYPSWLTHVLQGWKTTAAAVCSALIICALLNWIDTYIYIYKYWPYIFWSYVNIYIYIFIQKISTAIYRQSFKTNLFEHN